MTVVSQFEEHISSVQMPKEGSRLPFPHSSSDNLSGCLTILMQAPTPLDLLDLLRRLYLR